MPPSGAPAPVRSATTRSSVTEEIRVPRAGWDAMSAGQRDAYLADRVDALVRANSSAGWREIWEG
ncbi:DUF7167 family protein [Microbispora bryophytorum]|uniref:DUF7167 family protein n=1 Tax=Microbispora bryophytorum TaxID=1460882 RepID=UPI003F4CB417